MDEEQEKGERGFKFYERGARVCVGVSDFVVNWRFFSRKSRGGCEIARNEYSYGVRKKLRVRESSSGACLNLPFFEG